MADKYLKQSSGSVVEQAATTASTGSSDAGKIVALDSSGKLDTTMLPSGVGADTVAITASEALSAGDLVNVWSSSGSFRARKADASTSGKEAHGFVLAAVSNGASATVYFEGSNTQLTSLTPGVCYLSASTPGAVTQSAPTGSGQVVQRVGFATSATSMNFQSEIPIVLA